MDIPSLPSSHFSSCCCESTYICALPSASYFSAIGHPLTATAAAYLCDCDPLDHGTHDIPGMHTIGCLPSL